MSNQFLEASHESIQRALLVHVEINKDTDDLLNEFVELVESAGLDVVGTVTTTRTNHDPQYFIGKGKVDEVAEEAGLNQADVIIFNHSLSPAQERNLEKQINLRVIDRIGLILDIFAQRARTYEGKLQVELAQLQHLSTRLIRGWTHLERQKGGIGLRGPGETQLETDRRLIGQRIKMINRRLGKVRKQRSLSRQQRKKNELPVISLVGYTNAGKSTLFNRLTGAQVRAADQLFATLDPTLRKIQTGTGKSAILTDTVGFIRDLPHDLIESFQATLEEVHEADLLIHVIDVEQEQRQQRIDEVNQVIEMISASDVPQIEVYNKIDLHPELEPRIEISDNDSPIRVWLSSKTGAGIELLNEAMEQHLNKAVSSRSLNLPVTAGHIRAKLFDLGAVRREDENEEGGWTLEVELEDYKLDKLFEEASLDISKLQ